MSEYDSLQARLQKNSSLPSFPSSGISTKKLDDLIDRFGKPSAIFLTRKTLDSLERLGIPLAELQGLSRVHIVDSSRFVSGPHYLTEKRGASPWLLDTGSSL